jgi:hypothetical protein
MRLGSGGSDIRGRDRRVDPSFFDARDLVRSGAESALLKNLETSLLTKHEDWSNEAEFR